MHPVQLGPIDLESSSSLIMLRDKLSATFSDLRFDLKEVDTPELFGHFFPSLLEVDLRAVVSHPITLNVFPGGVSVLVYTKEYQFESVDELIQDVENDRTSILLENSIKSILQSICDQRGNWHSKDIEDSAKPKLMWAYCQLLHTDNADQKLAQVVFDTRQAVDENVRFSNYEGSTLGMSPSVITLEPSNSDVFRRVTSCLSAITLMTAVLYQIQTRALSISRDLLTDGENVKNQFDSLELYVRAVNIYDQLIAEFKQNDFLGNAFEETVAYPLTSLWQFDALVQKTESAVKRLKSHISSLESEVARVTQKRTNSILFIFTLISIITVTGSIVGLYDITQEIGPGTRLALVFGNFVIGSGLIIWFINRPKVWGKVN